MTTSGDTNYPPGVTGAEPVFHDEGRTGDEEAPCQCGHSHEDHEGDADCTIRGCDCKEYDPYEETDHLGY